MFWFEHHFSGEQREVSGGGAGGCSLRRQNVSGLRVDVEEESTASNDWIGLNHLGIIH